MNKKVNKLIKGSVFLNDRMIENSAVAINNGKIEGIFHGSNLPRADEMMDFKNCWIFPGFIDAHVHSRSNINEGFFRATSAAAAGGITAIVDHPLDFPQGVRSKAEVQEKIEQLEKEAVVDIALLGGVVDTNLSEINAMAEAGVCGFKLLLHDTAPERFSRMHDGQLYEAFSIIKKTGLVAGIHAENDDMIKYNMANLIEQGMTEPVAHCQARPWFSETEAVFRAGEFALASGVHLHLFHLSVARAGEIACEFKKMGASITSETCPHYLLFSEDDMKNFKGYGKINPPLRKRDENSKLWNLLADGKLDCYTSDHVAWEKKHKEFENIFKCSSGAPGVETLLPVIFSEGVMKGRISLKRMVDAICVNPAKIFKLYPRKGNINPGADGDLTVIDPEAEWIADGSKMKSISGWSLCNGMKFKGKVILSMVRGEVVFREGEILVSPGYGNFIPAFK